MLNLKNREKVIKTLLQPIRDEYDYILIDCSPSLGLITDQFVDGSRQCHHPSSM